MGARARVRLAASMPADVVDAGMAAGLLLIVGAQVAGERPDSSLLAYLAFAPAITLPLAWRRRAPLLVLVVVSAALVGQAFVAAPAISFGEFLAVMLATYSVAAHGGRSEAAVGALVVAAAVVAHTARQPDAASSFEWVYGVVYFGGAFTLGRTVRRRLARLLAEREAQASAATAAERVRLARELHDVIAHSVGLMVVQAGAARVSLDGGDERARTSLQEVEETGGRRLRSCAGCSGS